MSRAEFEAWIEFYKKHPFDDAHRYHRPAAWLTMAFNGVQPVKSMVWLTDEIEDMDMPNADGLTGADLSTLRALGLTPPKRST